jgi:glycine cleavage system H protein
MGSTERLCATVDKFVFTVPTDRAYSSEHCWVQREGVSVKVGLTDFRQQSIGDVAFAECKPEGSVLAAGAELANLETIKTNVVVPSPVGGSGVAVNESLSEHPELVNEDCYGQGWLVALTPAQPQELEALLSPSAYLALMVKAAEAARTEG